MTSNIVRVSAPGKVILHGEHAVVYGKTAIAAGLDLRTELTLEKCPGQDKLVVSLPDIGTHREFPLHTLAQLGLSPDPGQVVAISSEVLAQLKQLTGTAEDADAETLALVAFLYLFLRIGTGGGSAYPSVKLTVKSQLPVGAGLGSSAAYSVCLASALLQFVGAVQASEAQGEWSKEDLELINGWAFQAERVIHGTPSGIDNSVSTFGAAIAFKGGNITKLDRVPQLRVLLTNTGVARSTKLLVAGVRRRHDQFPGVIGPVLDGMEALSVEAQRLYEDMVQEATPQHYSLLEELIDVNQHLLNSIGVGHPSLDTVCQLATSSGLHTKLTGAGGGGCAWTLLPPSVGTGEVEELRARLEQQGYSSWVTSVGAPGVRLHREPLTPS